MLSILLSSHAKAGTISVTSSTSWSSLGTVTSGDIVAISNGATLTVDVTNAICGEVQIGQASGGTGTLSFASSGSPSLTVSTAGGQNGAVTVGYSSASGTLTMTSGCSLTVNNFPRTYTGTFNTNAGTLYTTGSFTMPSGGTWANVVIGGGGTVHLANTNTFNSSLVVSSGAVLYPGNGAKAIGSGTLSGAGTINITAGGYTNDLTHQYGMSTLDLSSLTLNFIGSSNAVDAAVSCANITIGTNTTFSADITVSGTTTINSGNTLTMGAANVLSGDVAGAGTIAVTATGHTDDLVYQYPGTITVSHITFSGSGSAQSLPTGTYTSLTVNNSSGTTLSGDVTLSGALTFTSGTLTLGSYNLIINSGGSFSGGSSNAYIVINGSGSVTVKNVSSVTIPIGDEYAPVTISNGGGADYTVGLINSVTDNGGSPTLTSHAVSITWNITPSATESNVGLAFQWPSSSELPSYDQSSSSIAMRSSPTGTWVPQTSTAVAGYTQSTTVGSMSGSTTYYFGVGDGTTALPVSLVSFSALYQGGQVSLNWKTASELNNAYFEIQRSTDGSVWANAGRIAGFGTSHTMHQYKATDNLAGVTPSPILYYRLKQVDFNGQYSISSIRELKPVYGNASSGGIKIYPNPSGNYIKVIWDNGCSSPAVLKVINFVGQTQLSEQVSESGNVTRLIDISALPAGNYVVQVSSGSGQQSMEFSKIK